MSGPRRAGRRRASPRRNRYQLFAIFIMNRETFQADTYMCARELSQLCLLPLQCVTLTDVDPFELEHLFTSNRATSLSTRLPTASSIYTVHIAATCCRRIALTASISARLTSTSVSSNASTFRASRCMLLEVVTRSASSWPLSRFQSSDSSSSSFNARSSDFRTNRVSFCLICDLRL